MSIEAIFESDEALRIASDDAEAKEDLDFEVSLFAESIRSVRSFDFEAELDINDVVNV